ncbi:MAG: hypothetical protein ACFFD4_04385 [Candidatus Odinarchaeota archaeon]
MEPLRRDLLDFRLSYVSFSRFIPLLLRLQVRLLTVFPTFFDLGDVYGNTWYCRHACRSERCLGCLENCLFTIDIRDCFFRDESGFPALDDLEVFC